MLFRSEAEIKKDAIQAIATGLEMHERLKFLNQSLAAKGLPQIEIGVGIHTGKVVAGSVGGKERLSYSVVGDTVNTSSRLESLNKKISEQFERPYNIVLSAATSTLIQNNYATQDLGKIPIRGRNEMMNLYTVVKRKID